MTAFEQAWDLAKTPIDVYHPNRGKIHTWNEDLYSGGDVRDDARYATDDIENALLYALFGSAVPYSEGQHLGAKREPHGEYPPMRPTIPARTRFINPPDDEHPAMAGYDEYSGAAIFDDYSDIDQERLGDDEVAALIQEYIDSVSHPDLRGTTGVGYSREERINHAKGALERLRHGDRSEPAPIFMGDHKSFGTGERDDWELNYPDYLESGYDWDELEDWQKAYLLDNDLMTEAEWRGG